MVDVYEQKEKGLKIYPAYINALKKRSEGRRVPLKNAVHKSNSKRNTNDMSIAKTQSNAGGMMIVTVF